MIARKALSPWNWSTAANRRQHCDSRNASHPLKLTGHTASVAIMKKLRIPPACPSWNTKVHTSSLNHDLECTRHGKLQLPWGIEGTKHQFSVSTLSLSLSLPHRDGTSCLATLLQDCSKPYFRREQRNEIPVCLWPTGRQFGTLRPAQHHNSSPPPPLW